MITIGATNRKKQVLISATAMSDYSGVSVRKLYIPTSPVRVRLPRSELHPSMKLTVENRAFLSQGVVKSQVMMPI